MSEVGSQIIFKELFARHQHVQVPIVQRDYAQGRESEIEVREEFLDALYSALILPEQDDSLPLNLDFIYGSVKGDGMTRFLPLDGQQRLTTLFLLHWYLAWKDNSLGEFKSLFCQGESSRFSYCVRPSSTEFFDALVTFEPNVAPESILLLSEMLIDQPWYFRNWRLDPTIQSCLIMLDAIHLRFKDSTGLFARITNVERPAITFQLLDLENFGLTDDLYIKMNARGKPLTAFENFKARYEQVLETLFGEEKRKIGDKEFPIAEFFSRQMDTKWADFFWPYRESETNVFDNSIMNLFRTVILITRDPENDSFIEDVTLLRNRRMKNSYASFHQRGWLDRQFSELLILLLEIWSGDGTGFKCQLPNTRYYDEKAAFSKAVTEPYNFDYEEIVRLTGYVVFLKEHNADLDAQEFQEWMRIVFNLSVNTEYNRPADLQRSITGLLNLTPYLKEILVHFAKSDRPVTGFNQQQITEEKLKAQLIMEHTLWRELIDKAEEHGYFRGQIEFLLDFSGVIQEANSQAILEWNDAGHVELQSEFSDYLLKAESMFTGAGLKNIPGFLWERALLSIGDYLLPSGRNHSFLANAPADQASWKRLLRGAGTNAVTSRKILHQLWKGLDDANNLPARLDTIISKAENLEPWRDALVHTPSAIGYCYRRLIRRNGGDEIYLLQTTQMNGTHAELFTYCLYENRIPILKAKGQLKDLDSHYESQYSTDYEPGIALVFKYNGNRLHFYIEYKKAQFRIYILWDKVMPYPALKSILLENLRFVEDTSTFTKPVYIKKITPNLIESNIIELYEKLTATPIPNS